MSESMFPGWEYFSRKEFSCKCGCGFNTVDAELLSILLDVRVHFSRPITITSGCRCLRYNRGIKSKDTSQHTKGRAADIQVKDVSPNKVYTYLATKYPGRYGLGSYFKFTHIDTRTGTHARW